MPDGMIQSRIYRQFRADLKFSWAAQNAACGICGQRTIRYDGAPNEPDSFELDHRISRKRRPDLALDPSNAQPSHVRCNRAKQAGDGSPALGETSESW